MRKAGLAVLLSGLFVLMLSALVVAPEEAGVPPEPLPPIVHAVFLPVAGTPVPAGAQPVSDRTPVQSAVQEAVTQPAQVQGEPPGSDSNGRVLRACRYENSVYQVFRPEVAGG